MKISTIAKNGLIKENPVFVLVLGMCPTIGVTTSAINGAGMGLATTFVLMMSNLVVSCVKNLIPDKVRIPAFIVIIATFVTILKMAMEAYIPDLYATLGLFIPLIVVNCVVLARAESFASKNGPLESIFDGIGMGLGFTLALGILGAVREIIGSGKIFGISILPDGIEPIRVIGLAPGAFFVLAGLTAIQNKVKLEAAKKGKKVETKAGCGEGCGNCTNCGGGK